MKKKNGFVNFISNNLVIFYILSFTWGFITSFIGSIICLIFLIVSPKRLHILNGRIYGIFSSKFGECWGFEMGCFFFISNDSYADLDLCVHEMGHGIQNILWGPLMLFVISIPSFIRYWYRELFYYKRHKIPKTAYDDIWFEGQATRFGKTYIID